MKKLVYFSVFSLFLLSCSKQNYNNRLFAGNWELKNINVKTYSDNVEVSSKDTSYYGVMQLQNSKDVIDGNTAYFTDYVPFPTSYCNWNVSTGKAKTIVFYLWDVDLGINYSYSYNIDKISKRKMILTQFISDDSLNVEQKVTIEFLKK